jgi:hypothetical protein
MIDDLIFFGIEHSVPEEKGISFLFRMFQAWQRKMERYGEVIKDVFDSRDMNVNTITPPGFPAEFRKRGEKYKRTSQ